jgi:hypothetical protein
LDILQPAEAELLTRIKSNYFRLEDYVAACRDRMTMNLSNVRLDLCEDMPVMHRD